MLTAIPQPKGRGCMAPINERLDRLVLEARRSAEQREQGYRAKALKLFPWVCGRCARTFDHANLQLLEVHHKNNNHHDNLRMRHHIADGRIPR